MLELPCGMTGNKITSFASDTRIPATPWFSSVRVQSQPVNNFPTALLLASSIVLVAAPAFAGVRSWQFDERQNRLEFTTDEGVQPQAQLVSNPTRLVIDLPGVNLGRSKLEKSYRGNIRAVRIGQFTPQMARIVVELAPGYTLDAQQVKFRGLTSRQWTVQLPTPKPIASGSTPAVVVEAQESEAASLPRSPNTRPWQSQQSTGSESSSEPSNRQPATIDAVELNQAGTQLLIRGDQPLRYTTRWDSSTLYRITITNAQLAKNLRGPSLSVGSSIQQLRLRQESSDTVAVLLQPASGVKIDAINQPSQQSLAVQLQRSRSLTVPSRSLGSIPVPPPVSSRSPSLPSRPIAPIEAIPQITNGRPIVVVDPGHGGPDPGAVGIGGIQEKDIVLDVSLQLASILQQQGVQSVLTRQTDIDLDLQPRVDLAERVNATLFVSIHANAIDMSRPDVNGLETYYYDSGAGLAQSIHASVLEATGIPDRRVRTARFYVLRRTSMPSVLVELGFVTGQEDVARLNDPRHRTLLAQAIARGILRYIQRTAGTQ